MKNILYKTIRLHHPASAGIILLNLPTAVQSPRSKGDGQYDAGYDDENPANEVPNKYVPEPVTEDNVSAHVLTDDIILRMMFLVDIPEFLADDRHQQEHQEPQ